MRVIHFVMGMLFLVSTSYSTININFQEIALGGDGGFLPCGRNLVIQNQSEFIAFCDSINLNRQTLSYLPNFDSVQVVAIGYQADFETSQINTITNNGDTICVEIAHGFREQIEGVSLATGYRYQIVAIQKQSNPIKFKLVSSTGVRSYGVKTNSQLSGQNSELFQTYDLLGRHSANSGRHQSFGVKIIRNSSKSFSTKSLIVDRK